MIPTAPVHPIAFDARRGAVAGAMAVGDVLAAMQGRGYWFGYWFSTGVPAAMS